LITIAFFIFTYAFLLIFDSQQQQQQQQQQINYLIKRKHVNRLIFGGSNSLNSLSARQLSAITNEKWQNLSMSSELGGKLQYNNFILKTASEIMKNDIEIVVYSSILPFSFNSTDNYNKRQFYDGFNFIPYTSVAGHLKNYYTNHSEENDAQGKEMSTDELIFNSFGDYTNLTKNCFYQISNNKFNPEIIEKSTNFLVDRSLFLANVFPNSKIYIVLPSLYHSLPERNFLIYTDKLKESFNSELLIKYPQLTDRVILIVQPFFPIVNYVCNDPHHSTAIGRVWRTNDLLKSILDLEK
jgi:hypothetical protein